jgi:hypothetical protein
MSGVSLNMMNIISGRSASQCTISAVKMMLVRKSGQKNNVISTVRNAVITVRTTNLRAISKNLLLHQKLKYCVTTGAVTGNAKDKRGGNGMRVALRKYIALI